MMEAPSANQNRASCQSLSGQDGCFMSSNHGSHCDLFPSLQLLSLASPSEDRTTCTGFPSDHSTSSSTDSSQHSTVRGVSHVSNASSTACAGSGEPSMQPVISSTSPNTNRVKNAHQPSHSLVNELPQPCQPQQMPLCSAPYSPYQAVSSPTQFAYARYSLLNGPESPHQKVAPPFQRGSIQQSQTAPQPNVQTDNVRSAGRAQERICASSITGVQQQSGWIPPPHCEGDVNNFAPSAFADHYKAPTQEDKMLPQSPTSESRYGLDPELLPSAVKVMAEDREQWEGKVFVSEPFSHLPPLATTSCVIEDSGNASPRVIRSTTYCIPCEGQDATLSHLPLGVLVTPFAKQSAQENPLPVCKDVECLKGCGWCGAFMSPAMCWQDCGQRFFCPFCGQLSEVPWQHYQPTKGVPGVRFGKEKKPELSVGSYEILNPQKDEPAALLLAIDVSSSALRAGHLEFVTQQLHTLLTSLIRTDDAAWSNTRVGLITYDSRIHLYDLSPTLSCPHMLVITETADLQLPVREGLLVSLKHCIDSIGSVLQLIPQYSPEFDGVSAVPLELTIKAALAVLQPLNCPGKLLIFHTAPLVEGTHKQSSSGYFGSNTPKSIFQPSEETVSLAKECVSQGCSVNLFVLCQQDVGGAWPGNIPYLTGGALYICSHLKGGLDKECFSSDLKRTVETGTAYKAELRIFVSKGLHVSGCYGMFAPGPSPAQVTVAALDGQTTLAVEFRHTRALDEAGGAVIQAVLSYRTQTGERRTRVHTLILRCSRHLQDTFRHCQAQTLLAFYCKKIYCTVLERPLQELREELQMEITEALASYRKHCCSASVSAGQLVLPQFLRALPVYINSLRKSEVLLPGLRSSIHQRLQQRCQALSMDPSSTATLFYPLLLPLPLDGSSPPNPEEAQRCTAASLDPRGLYLVHTALNLLLWVGANVPACTLVELFNTSCLSSLPSGEDLLLATRGRLSISVAQPVWACLTQRAGVQFTLPALECTLSINVRSLINTLNSEAKCARKLWVVKQGDTCEDILQRHLVEDKSPNGGASYADFLYHVHVNSVRLLQ